MPRGDGTGPDGKGPKTGRGKGSCKNDSKPGKNRENREERNPQKGRERNDNGRGQGRGKGRNA